MLFKSSVTHNKALFAKFNEKKISFILFYLRYEFERHDFKQDGRAVHINTLSK